MFANQTQTALEFAAQFDAVRETADAQRALIEASPVAILDLDLDGTVRAWNRAAERLFGWTEAEVLGRRMPIVPPAGRDEFQQLRVRLARGEALSNVPLRRVRKDGTLVDLRFSATPVRDSRGRVTRVVAIHTEA
jgi:PAS domain S-box-containing protein